MIESGPDDQLHGDTGALELVAIGRVGFARAALETASEHLHEQRKGFFPHRWAVIEDELELMGATIDRARRLNHIAQWARDQGRRTRLESSAAKAFGPPAAERIVRRCMQLLGPEGASTDLLLEKWYRDVKIVDIFDGTGQVMRLLVSRELLGRDNVG